MAGLKENNVVSFQTVACACAILMLHRRTEQSYHSIAVYLQIQILYLNADTTWLQCLIFNYLLFRPYSS